MKSKKRTRTVTNVADWQDKWIDVTALRDYTLNTDPAGDKFVETAVGYLKKAYGVEYSFVQVTRKLDRIWNGYGRDGPKRPNLIYQEGSACLENLSTEVHEKIEKRRNAIAHEYLIENLSQRTTRSASKCGSKNLLPFDIESSPSPRKRFRAEAVRQSPCPRDQRLCQEQLQDTLENELSPLPKQENWHTPPDTSLTQPFIQDSFEETNSDGDSDSGPDESVRLSNNIEVVIPRRQLAGDTSTTIQPLTLRPSFVSERSDAVTQTNADGGKNEYLDQLEERLCDLRKKYNADIAFYENRMEKSRDEIKKLKDELKSWYDICDDNRNEVSLEKRLLEKETENTRLHNTLKDRRTMHAFSSLSSTGSMPLDKSSIKSQMESMGDKIKSLADFDDVGLAGFQPCGEAEASMSLLSRVAPCVVGGARTSLKTVIPQALKLNELIRTLVAAAVCSWVFESPLQFLSDDPPCMLLRRYRSRLEKQDGKFAVRNLEFAAHSELLGDYFFQKHIVPREARRLTSTLCQTLRPLFEHQQRLGFQPRSSLHNTSTIVNASTFDDRSNLEEIFEIALRVKARLLTSTDAFEAILHAPGSTFTAKMMRAENSQGEEIHLARHETPEVKCCYLPSLIAHKRDRQMVGYGNFIRTTEGIKPGCERFTKALVVVVM